MHRRIVVWSLTLSVAVLLVLFDLSMASRRRAAKPLATDAVSQATPLDNSTVSIVRSDSPLLRDPVAADQPLTYAQIKEMVWTAIDLAPAKTGLLPALVPDDSWVVVKPNMVFIKTQEGRGGYFLGDITDPRVTQATLEYLAENTRARRITLAMGGSWKGLDGPDYSFDGGLEMQDGVAVDGWTCTFGDDYPDFEGSFQQVLAALSAAHPEKVFDKGNFNYDLFPNQEEPRKVPVPESNGIRGWSMDEYYVSNMILNCDVFISLAAMKTHDIPGITLGHKNYIGTASRAAYGSRGWWNGKLHSQPGGPDAVITDLVSYHPADFVILGGAWGVEGQGPHNNSGAHSIRTNMIIAGPDPVATDAVGATVMGFNPWDIEHLRRSAAKGHGTLDMRHITVSGDPIDKVQMGYRKPARSGTGVRFYYGRSNMVWLIHGTHDGATLEEDVLGGEADATPFEGVVDNGQVWTRMVSNTYNETMDLKSFFYDRYGVYTADVVAYAFTYIHSDREQEGQLWVGADDGVKVWLNGEVVVDEPESGRHMLAEHRVPIRLRAGENRVLLKVRNEVGDYIFSLMATDGDGDTMPGIEHRAEPAAATLVEESAGDAATPSRFALEQNYPNPFNGSTVIRFALPEPAEVELAVYNTTGQKVAALAQENRPAGTYTFRWHGRDGQGRDLASGVYLYRLRAGDRVSTRRLLLLR